MSAAVRRAGTTLSGSGSSVAVMVRQVAGPPATSFDPINEAPGALWYVRPPTGGQFGPASAHLFRQWMREGRVAPDSWIWRQGWENWVPASQVFSELGREEISAQFAGETSVARIRSTYLKARRRRTMWTTVGLVAGTLVVGLLILVLVYLAQLS
jgi:hypothetical protein